MKELFGYAVQVLREEGLGPVCKPVFAKKAGAGTAKSVVQTNHARANHLDLRTAL